MAKKLNKRKLGMQYGFEAYFRNQDKQPEGKIGIIFANMGVPEDYSFDFYKIYMTHLFKTVLPPFISPMVLADKGAALSDPANPVPEEEFKPETLMDANGSTVNKAGKPYAECKFEWVAPNPKKAHDNGYFLYKEDGKFGAPTVAQKSGAKVGSWYYHSLLTPSMKCGYQYQIKKVYDELVAEIEKRYTPDQVICRSSEFVFQDDLKATIEELLAEGCKTIVYCSMSNPVFSDFEEYNSSFPFVAETVGDRAKVIFTDQSGASRHIQQVRMVMLKDELAKLPQDASVYLILSRHGHPFKKESMDWRGALARKPLEEMVIEHMSENWKGKWDFCWANDEFTEGVRFETKQAYENAINGEYDYAIEIPTDFIFENTDLMIHHARKKFTPFSDYSQFNPVDYPDWDLPLRREFHEGKTTGIYISVPVGEKYRPFVVRALLDTVLDVTEFKQRHQIGH